ncbi:hypothetical protein BJ508DRAFT_41320 [Ascobolus immersus RN42]|uniref:PNPLA domain-containing protein n=1 Tax=Ascobolus immersus RN42 TaxID=1160509 RepID=A0A3N4HLA2_ASCIM|nr:hypothetical protein BJ508DRAFT_41320 [Ascobolus immersus RN42]
MADANRPLRLLALDGGGVRGLTSLLILETLMHQLGDAKPCEHFDMIAGTSTGGLIAIMLGLLEMDVKTCIKAYRQLAKRVFKPRTIARFLGRFGANAAGLSAFDEGELEEAIRAVLKGHGFPSGDGPLLMNETKRCKVFVMATMDNAKHVRLRSYRHPYEVPIDISIVKAARATSAAPGFFPTLVLPGFTFYDGALGNNNPTAELVREATEMFENRPIGCIVSIGTGVSRSEDLGGGKSLMKVAKTCAHIATNTENAHQAFLKDHCNERADGKYANKYFRFNVLDGCQGVGLEEWDKDKQMTQATKGYLSTGEVQRDMRNCIACIKDTSYLCPPFSPTLRPVSPTPSFDPTVRVSPPPPHDPYSPPPNRPNFAQQSSHHELVHRGHSPQPSFADNDVRGFNPEGLPRHFNENGNGYNDFGMPPEKIWGNLEYHSLREASHYCPRQPIMDGILENLEKNRMCTLVGIGGSGKTQLALKIAHNEKRQYTTVFWFECCDHENLTQSFFKIGLMLGVASHKTATMRDNAISRRHDQDYIVEVKRWLGHRLGQWLLVFDNCDDVKVLEDLKNYFPQDLSKGHIIVTSRKEDAFHLVADGLQVGGLEPPEAIELLFKHAGVRNPTDKDKVHAEEIVLMLDCLALAVDLAGGFIRKQSSSLMKYVTLYNKNKDAVLKKLLTEGRSGTYPSTVFCAWDLSIKQMKPGARNLIFLIAFLDRTNVRVDLFKRCCQARKRWGSDGLIRIVEPEEAGVPTWLTDIVLEKQRDESKYIDKILYPTREVDDFKMAELISEITSFSFAKIEKPKGSALYEYADGSVYEAKVSDSEEVLAIHPLLHEIARLYLEEPERLEFAGYAQKMLWHSIDDDVDECFRHVAEPIYRPMITLGGGATIDPVRLALRLDETYRHLRHFLKTVLTEKMTEVPEIGSFPSLLVCFDLLYLVRTSNEKGKASKDPFGLLDQSCGWDKLNNEIKRARLLSRPNILEQWMGLASRAPEIWRKEFEPPSLFERVAKSEAMLYRGYKRKKKNDGKNNGLNFLNDTKLLQGQLPLERDVYAPIWMNILRGAESVRNWIPDYERRVDEQFYKAQTAEWVGEKPKEDAQKPIGPAPPPPEAVEDWRCGKALEQLNATYTNRIVELDDDDE